MRHKLRWLAAIAIATLLCLIGLQFFWLRTTYKDQEKRFMADAQNALIAAQVKLSMQSYLKKDKGVDNKIVAAILPDVLTEIFKKADKFPALHSGNVSLNMEMPDSELAKSPELSKLLSQLKDKTTTAKHIDFKIDSADNLDEPSYSLASFKTAYLAELHKQGIEANVALALLDKSGEHIGESSCDSIEFRNIGVKTGTVNYGFSDNDRIEYVQAAFPSVNWYLLQKMLWILVVSITLILICISSFFYLIALFFRQKKLSEVRDDFMNNMTHELKTPISSVSVALELIDDAGRRGAMASVKEYIDIAQGELNRLTMLVEKVLKIAAFEKSDIKIAKETFLAAPWIQKIMNSFKPIFETGGVVCEIEITPELVMIFADKTHLTNVLQNLIDNAVKYNDKVKPIIKIRIAEEENHVTISVTDNGKGIPDNYINKIFDKFFRVPAGNLHDVKGYGLGLSYIKAVIDLHQGIISVQSTINESSTFKITIPKEG